MANVCLSLRDSQTQLSSWKAVVKSPLEYPATGRDEHFENVKGKDNKSSASSHHSHTTVQSGICWTGPNGRSEQLLSCSKVLLHAVPAAQCQPKQFVYEHFASVVQWATWGWWEFYSSPHTFSPSLYIHFPLATHFHIFPSKLPFPLLFPGSYLKPEPRSISPRRWRCYLCARSCSFLPWRDVNAFIWEPL